MPQKTLFTDEQVEFIKENVQGRPRKESLALVNEQFNIDVKMNQWIAWMKNHGITSGHDARFPKGHVPANKGRKGVDGWEPTQFKSGHRPHNYKAVGTERVNGDGYVDIKIADPNKWRAKHLLTYEAHHGPIPDGHVVIFGDMNRRNFNIENLILITRKQLVIMNKKKLIYDDLESTKTGIIIADISAKVMERKKA